MTFSFLKKIALVISILAIYKDLSGTGIKNASDADKISYTLLVSSGTIETMTLYEEKKKKYKNLDNTNPVCYNYLINAYYNQYLMLDEGLRNNYFIKGSEINEYLENLVSLIQARNKEKLDQEKNYTVLIVRSYESNAYSLGDGIIAVTMGLLVSIDNESELASILCHELAHDALEHCEKSMMRHSLMHTSNEIGDSINYILEEGLYSDTRMQEYLAKIYSKHMRKSRHDELEADSLGFLMLGLSGFQASNAVLALKKINEPIPDRYKVSICNYLISKNIKVSDKWYYKGDDSRMSDIVNNEVYFMDTMPSHPEIEFRIKRLSQMMAPQLSTHEESISQEFINMRINSLIQIILNSHLSDNPSLTVCYALVLKNIYPEQVFSDNMVVIGLCKAMLLKQQLRLNISIGNTDSANAMGLNEVIQLMQKIRTTEFNNVACPLMESVPGKTDADIYSFTAVLFSGYFCLGKNKYNYLINNYKHLYKKGFFRNDLIYLPKKKRI